jgi:asparagine synthase (glutamine-hydrolysing)
MSGICGVVQFDGAPVDRGLVRRMTRAMAFRGPDRQDTWVEGEAGLGHALLQTGLAPAAERQPLSLDGRAWIIADARIDGQRQLKSKLAARGRDGLEGCSDAGLILHAWHAWGEDCVKHLLGDFAFALWDARSKELFCARDPFGIKPFFYARVGRGVVFSNTLDCLRSHPGVSSELDELAIADFLLFDMSQEPRATAFAAIRRLPPSAHVAISANGFREGTHWALPGGQGVRYRDKGDYVEHFRELLEEAVADRLRTHCLAIQMSGGLDSPAIAATAKRLLVGQSRPFDLQAHTIVYDRLLPDEERHYSGIAALSLGIPINYYAGDDYRLYERFEEYATHFAEPYHAPDAMVFHDALRGVASQARVLLTGYDGDTLLSESPKPYFRALWRQRKLAPLLAGVVGYAVSERRFWPLAWQPWRSNETPTEPAYPAYPAWLNPDFERRLGLRERWKAVRSAAESPHEVRPFAHRNLSFLATSSFFDHYDAGVTRLPLECRHPFLDVRVVEYCFSLPPMPWCVRKHILREAMRAVLPEPILRRPKTPMASWAGSPMMAHAESRWIDAFVSTPGLERFVERDRIPRMNCAVGSMGAWSDLRPLTLDRWIRASQNLSNPMRSSRHEIA